MKVALISWLLENWNIFLKLYAIAFLDPEHFVKGSYNVAFFFRSSSSSSVTLLLPMLLVVYT